MIILTDAALRSAAALHLISDHSSILPVVCFIVCYVLQEKHVEAFLWEAQNDDDDLPFVSKVTFCLEQKIVASKK